MSSMKLTICLYRGLYLDRYAGEKVYVCVEIPGCVVKGSTRLLKLPGEVSEKGVLRFDSQTSTLCLKVPNQDRRSFLKKNRFSPTA